MSAISAMPSAIAAWLGEQEALEGIRFLTEFPAQNKAVPLRGVIVAVGLSTVSITDKFEENNDGVLERQEYCRSAAIRLRFGIHVPFADGGARCHEIFTQVLDMLTFASDLNLRTSGCREVTAHRDTDAFVLEAWADVQADFCPAESTGLTLPSFLPKDLLCGSHIADQGIHLSTQEKAWLGAPYQIGGYIGNGAATQAINLGFAPQAVFVMAAQFPPVHPNYTAQASMVYFGMAVRTGSTAASGSMGIEMTNSGFQLRSGSAFNYGASSPRLNESGTDYLYFAMK